MYIPCTHLRYMTEFTAKIKICDKFAINIILDGIIKTLRSRQQGLHFADNIFKCISLIENDCILIKILLKVVPEGPTGIKSALI